MDKPTPSAAPAEPSDERREAGQALLDAAYAFWTTERKSGQPGAVKWLTGSGGELVIYTRGEYRDTLMRNIDKVGCEEHFFGDAPKGEPTAALQELLDHVDRETCRHEDIYRGGAIWTICRDCGRKWADDEGGFQPYEDAPAVAKARAILDQPSPTMAAPKSNAGAGLRPENESSVAGSCSPTMADAIAAGEPSDVTFAPPSDKELLKAFSRANNGKQLQAIGDRQLFLSYARIGVEAGRARPALASSAGTPHGAREPAALNDDSTAVDLWAEIWRLREAVKGPTGYATWQDAATDERIRRVKAEAALKAREPSEDAKDAARVPMTDEQIEDLRGEANRGFDIEREHYFKAFRDAERAHGIGQSAKEKQG